MLGRHVHIPQAALERRAVVEGGAAAESIKGVDRSRADGGHPRVFSQCQIGANCGAKMVPPGWISQSHPVTLDSAGNRCARWIRW
jgi:hypothetical protein